jgi:hypothetical protein
LPDGGGGDHHAGAGPALQAIIEGRHIDVME